MNLRLWWDKRALPALCASVDHLGAPIVEDSWSVMGGATGHCGRCGLPVTPVGLTLPIKTLPEPDPTIYKKGEEPFLVCERCYVRINGYVPLDCGHKLCDGCATKNGSLRTGVKVTCGICSTVTMFPGG